MLPLQPSVPTVTLLPPQLKEAVITFDALSYIMETSFAKIAPLPKNIYLLLDNSFSMNSSMKKIIEFIKEYFNFLYSEERDYHFQHKINGSTFGQYSIPVPSGGDNFLNNLLKIFDSYGWNTLLAPGLERAVNDWMQTINPNEPYDNLLILITDGANQDKEDVKKIREAFLSLLKIKNVALYIFGLNDIATAKSTIDNFTNLNNDDPTSEFGDSTLKIKYFFADSENKIQKALQILKNHRTVLKNATVGLYSNNPQTTLRLVGFPNCQDSYPSQLSTQPQATHFLGTLQELDLKSLTISIQGDWPDVNGLAICISGTDPTNGKLFSSGILQISIPSQPEVNIEALLATLPKLAQEARKSKNRDRQQEILKTISLVKTTLGNIPLLVENEKYLENALKETPASLEDSLLDALKSLSITGASASANDDNLFNELNNLSIKLSVGFSNI